MNKIIMYIVLSLTALAFASCGSSDEPSGEENHPSESEIISQKIVGVWKNGAYFVSFSKEHFNSAFLNSQTIDEGTYSVNKDTILVNNSFRGVQTKYVIKSIIDSTLTCEVTYHPFNIRGYSDAPKAETKVMTFKQTKDKPCVKEHNLIGKTYEARYWAGYDGRCTFSQYNIMDFYRTWFDKKHAHTTDHLTRYYVYLSPEYIYFIQWTDGGIMWDVQHLKVKLNSDGQISDIEEFTYDY